MLQKKYFDELFAEIDKVIIGQDEVVEQVLIALLCDGNALLEGYPGLAKTLLVKTLAQAMDLRFSRIQNTPDLMPSDVTGTYIIEEVSGKRNFKFQPGPIFANMVLADEINRATPKTQSALLEAMQEKQVTVGNSTFKLDLPFFVLATMNPIEQEGSLSLSQAVLVNGQLQTGNELLEQAKHAPVVEDRKGMRLYDIGGWTLSLNTVGKLERRRCMLYTLPYNDEMVTITTKTGKRIRVTKNHPFLVNDRGVITWKKAEELTKQDYLVSPAKVTLPQPEVMSHEKALSRMTQKKLAVEIPFDEDFAFWIAFVLSDGSIGEKCIEAVQKNYPEALDRFIEVSKRYGYTPRVREQKGCRYARIYSKPLIEYLKLRFGIRTGKGKEIPSWFLSLPDGMNREFLKTFISLESSLRDERIVFTQKSANNVSIISYMLLRVGIRSWIRHDGRIYRMKIQGEDLVSFAMKLGWIAAEKLRTIDLARARRSSFRVVPVERMAILELVSILGINSFHTLKGRKAITERPWYGSYRGIKDGEVLMSTDSLKIFVKDMREEMAFRGTPEFDQLLEQEPRRFAAGIGTPMTEICSQLKISRNQVWKLYTSGASVTQSRIMEFLSAKHKERMALAERLLQYCEALLSEDVYYDRVKSIDYSSPEGMAFGLTVPELQNYLAGFGGCGISHNTYPLPEAQADRFLVKVKVVYPTFKDEVEIVNLYAFEAKDRKVRSVMSKEKLLSLQTLTKQVPISNDLKERVVKIVAYTRNRSELMEYGASPRASIGMILAAKARALIKGRNFVSSEDINSVAYPVLRHRIILSFEAQRKGLSPDDVIKQVLEKAK